MVESAGAVRILEHDLHVHEMNRWLKNSVLNWVFEEFRRLGLMPSSVKAGMLGMHIGQGSPR